MHPVFFTTDLEDEIVEKCLNTDSFIGRIGSYRFYEHPDYGDEAPLIAVNVATTQWGISHWWDLPKFEEIYGG